MVAPMSDSSAGTTSDLQDLDCCKYWAFISYSHADERFAVRLHKFLERYSVPKNLVGSRRECGTIPARLRPIFLDREELPAGASLGDEIHTALSESRTLVVICSPSAVASRYVNQEIMSFKRLGRSHRVRCVIVDGEPNAKPDSGLKECFPKALRFRINADGELSDIPDEPVAADVRPKKDGEYRAKLKIIAGILGISFDDLHEREKQRDKRRRKTRLLWVLGIFFLLAAFGDLSLQWLARSLHHDGRLRAERNEFSESEKKYSSAIRIYGLLPGRWVSKKVGFQWATCLGNRAEAYEGLGQFDDALRDWDQAVSFYEAHHSKEYKGSEGLLGRGLRNRGNTFRKLGRFADARRDYDRALEMYQDLHDDEGRTNLLDSLAWLYATCPLEEFRDGCKAVEYAKEAQKLTKRPNAELYDTLGAAYAERGDFHDAEKNQEIAVETAPKELKSEFQERLDLYRQRRPFREPSPRQPLNHGVP